MRGRPQSEETREKIRQASLGHLVSKATRAKISKANMGHSVSAETRAKISKGNTGNVFGLEARKRMSAGQLRRRARGGPELEKMKEKIRKTVLWRYKHPTKKMLGRGESVGRSLRLAYAEGRLEPPIFTKKGTYVSGWVSTRKGGRLYYRSSWEKRFLQLIDKASFVESFLVHPVRIPYKFNGKASTYFVDFLVRLIGGKEALVEVKGYHQDSKLWEAKRLAGESYSKKIGIKFFVFRKLPTTADIEVLRP